MLSVSLNYFVVCGSTAVTTLEVLPVWYDVDRCDDLLFLKTHLDLLSACGKNESPATARFLKQLEL